MDGMDLQPRHAEMVCGILKADSKIRGAKVFGFRARGKARKFSDLDLLLETVFPLDFKDLAALETAFSESSLPFRVDLADSSHVSALFLDAIKNDCIPLF